MGKIVRHSHRQATAASRVPRRHFSKSPLAVAQASWHGSRAPGTAVKSPDVQASSIQLTAFNFQLPEKEDEYFHPRRCAGIQSVHWRVGAPLSSLLFAWPLCCGTPLLSQERLLSCAAPTLSRFAEAPWRGSLCTLCLLQMQRPSLQCAPRVSVATLLQQWPSAASILRLVGAFAFPFSSAQFPPFATAMLSLC